MSKNSPPQREALGSRLGFILMTAGCAIGLGNIWRFPYVVGENGGGLFVILYLCFLISLGFPVLIMELSVGRAGQNVLPRAFKKLQNPNSKFKWQIPGYIFFSGNIILLMFYTVVTGWLLSYTYKYAVNANDIASTGTEYPEIFSNFLASFGEQSIFMIVGLVITMVICMGGLKRIVERSIKVIMGLLLILIIVLLGQSLMQKNAMEGVKFFFYPNIDNFLGTNIWSTVFAAMNQAFFTLSLGVGSIAICGSYIDKSRALTTESFWILGLDTFVAICAGIIIFGSCYAFGVSPNAGPALIFITLPQVFLHMVAGRVWGFIFFLFLSIAALSTLIAVFENLVALGIDRFKIPRVKSALYFGLILGILSLPCILGFNYWQGFQPLGAGTSVLDLEDFIVSYNLLPLGSLYITIFCTQKWGWGFTNFLDEANRGKGIKMSQLFLFYMRYVLPCVIFAIWLVGIIKYFNIWEF